MSNIQKAEASVEWLMQNARALGKARQRMVLAERMVDRIKALVMKKHTELPVSAQEREAKASAELFEAYQEEAEATGDFEMLRTLRDAHAAQLELFRTLEATARVTQKEAHQGRPSNWERSA